MNNFVLTRTTFLLMWIENTIENFSMKLNMGWAFHTILYVLQKQVRISIVLRFCLRKYKKWWETLPTPA